MAAGRRTTHARAAARAPGGAREVGRPGGASKACMRSASGDMRPDRPGEELLPNGDLLPTSPERRAGWVRRQGWVMATTHRA
eukprot:scaffold2126_cov417-Prasinococcus_capsulatus_cf.AAC.9